MKILTRLFFVLLLTPALSQAQDNHDSAAHHGHDKGVAALSTQLRNLLGKEMQALQLGMQAIIPATISGDYDTIENIATKMKNSYILKKSLSKHQIHELHEKLPAAFIEKDNHFHYLAGMLAHVAQERKTELVNFYYSQMLESCGDCHAKFATHRFPSLSAINESSSHSH